jgi:hypothetical protein
VNHFISHSLKPVYSKHFLFSFENDAEIDPKELADRFAAFFDDKVKSVTSNAIINDNVYNGSRKVFVENKFFMDTENL